MKLLCRWKQHKIARQLILGEPLSPRSALALHLEQCAECRCVSAHLLSLHRELSQVPPLSIVREGFADAVHAQIRAHTRTHSRRLLPRVITAGGGIGVVLLCIVLSRSTTSSSKPEIVVKPAVIAPHIEKPNSVQNFAAVPVPPQKKRLTLTAETGSYSKRTPRPLRRRLRLAKHFVPKPRRRYYAVAWNPKHQYPLAPFLTPEIRSRQWTQRASYFETCGDYSRAADAYARAYETLPSESTAFSAGQAAENAGDVSQAISYYSEILRQPLKQKPQTEKGTFLWNSNHDAA